LRNYHVLTLIGAIFLSAILVSGGISTSEAQQAIQDSIIVTTNVDPTPHILKLKALQDAEQQSTIRVSGFQVDTSNVISAPINSQLIVFPTDPLMSVMEVKVRLAAGEFLNLSPSLGQQHNTFSLANLPLGIYTLDIITQKESQKGAYEGLLVISTSNSLPLDPALIQEQITKASYDVDIIFKTVSDKKKGNDPCNYYGLNICDKNGDCDSERFDCWSECKDGSTAVTGQCPGDDDKDCWDNGEYNGKCDEDNSEEELPKCDGSYQDCVTEEGYTCEAGSTAHECEIDEEEEEYVYAEEEEEECIDCYEEDEGYYYEEEEAAAEDEESEDEGSDSEDGGNEGVDEGGSDESAEGDEGGN
jgi:hypothetical protein